MGRAAGVLGPGWERQPGAGGALRERTGAGDQRKPQRTACERGHRHAHGYSGQPARPPNGSDTFFSNLSPTKGAKHSNPIKRDASGTQRCSAGKLYQTRSFKPIKHSNSFTYF
jgi:hypothetical protein